MVEKTVLRLSGACDLQAAGVLRREWAAAFQATQDVEIDCVDVERIDLSFVQLVVAATRTAHREAKSFRLVNLPEAGQAVFLRAGLSLAGWSEAAP